MDLASAHVIANVPVAAPSDHASDARHTLAGRTFGTAVRRTSGVRGRRLCGLLTIKGGSSRRPRTSATIAR